MPTGRVRPPSPSQSIVGAVLNSGCVGRDIRYPLCYGLLLRHLKSATEHWLHPSLSIPELTHSYERQHLEAEWRSESGSQLFLLLLMLLLLLLLLWIDLCCVELVSVVN